MPRTTKPSSSKKNKTARSISKKIEPVSKDCLENYQEIVSDLRIISKIYSSSNIEFQIYQNIPSDRKITKLTDVGSRVIVAKYPNFYKMYFMEYIDVGKRHFPNGAIKIYNVTFEQTQYFYYDAVALHPAKKDKYRVTLIED